MKAYGKHRRSCANRMRRGTSRPCPCCIPKKGLSKVRNTKKTERQKAKKALEADE